MRSGLQQQEIFELQFTYGQRIQCISHYLSEQVRNTSIETGFIRKNIR